MTRPRTPHGAAGSLALLFLCAACTGSSVPPVTSPSSVLPSGPSAATPSVSPSPPPGSTGPTALVAALPVGCDPGTPDVSQTIAFVAGGRAWTVRPEGTGLTCLFDVADPGPFVWGPQADRVLLAGLEIRGAGADVSRGPEPVEPTSSSWGRPTGKAVVFADPEGGKLEKILLDRAGIENISPLRGAIDHPTYRTVAYHPSGLAIGFVAEHRDPAGTDSTLSEIYLSANTGADPELVVFSEMGTQFGPIAFGLGGNELYYVAHLANGTYMLADYILTANRADEHLWEAEAPVLDFLPPAAFGEGASTDHGLLNVGTGCDDTQAVATDFHGGAGTPLFPEASGPTTALGWVDPSRILVGVGGCEGPMDLWVLDPFAVGGVPHLLASGADAGAVRVAEPSPPPELPSIGVNAGVG